MRALAALLLTAWAVAAPAQDPLVGTWEGAIHVPGGDLAILVEIATDATGPKAKIDIPLQSAHGIALSNVRLEGSRIHFELSAGPGLAVFDGERQEGSMAGSFRQAAVEGTFELKRAQKAKESPPPYRVEEVSVGSGDVTLACTLTAPADKGPHPAVVLLTGSGPQNRDEEIFGFRIFGQLADHLTRNGLAVLRCDDRGVGGSTGTLATVTMEDLAGDALAEHAFLGGLPDVDTKRVGLLGHSEGALVGVIAAARAERVAFLALLSGPAVRGDVLLRAQGEAMARAEGVDEQTLRRRKDLQERSFDVMRTGKGAADLAVDIRKETLDGLEKLPSDARKAIADPERYADAAVSGQMAMILSPGLRFFLDFDPAPLFPKVRCPILAVFAEKDLQVPVDLNRRALEAALPGPAAKRLTVQVVAGANHLFQTASTGSPSEYATLPKQTTPGFLDVVTAWVKATTAPRPERTKGRR